MRSENHSNVFSQMEQMDSSAPPEPTSSSAAVQAPSCDLLSHTVGRPKALLPQSQEQRGRLSLSDRKLSLQERSQTATSPCSSPGLNGRYIYPSLPYSPITSPHSSPRLPRRPTVESHSVSITDLQVWATWKCFIPYFTSFTMKLKIISLLNPFMFFLHSPNEDWFLLSTICGDRDVVT